MATQNKLIWKALIGGAILAVVAAIPFFYPEEIKVEHSVFLKARPARVFVHLNTPSEWDKWSIWSNAHDPNHSSFFQGPVSGVNSEISWKGKEEEGKAIITDSEHEKSVCFRFFPSPEQELESVFLLEKEEEGTRLTWSAAGKTPGYVGRVKGIFLKRKLERDLSTGLQGLQKLVTPPEKKLATRKLPPV